jgi:FixJ family two-component response regulator
LIETSGWQPETFASAQEFLASPRPSVPSCLVFDVTSPDANGLDLQKRVAVDRSDMPIIFITARGDVRMSVQAMKAGAMEFLIEPFGDDVLLDAKRNALERSRRAPEHEARMKSLRDCYAALTRRERDVRLLVVPGLSNKQVAGELGISEMHGEGASRAGDAKDEGRLAAGAREHEQLPRPRSCVALLTAASVVAATRN